VSGIGPSRLGSPESYTPKHLAEKQAREHLTTATTMYREMEMRFWLAQAEAESNALA
jgi:hypothetical protein